MANTRTPYELKEADLNKVSAAGHIVHIAVVVHSSEDITINQTSGSQLDVITNNVPRVSQLTIGKQ